MALSMSDYKSMKNQQARRKDLGNAVRVPDRIKDDLISKYGASSSASGLNIPVRLPDAVYHEYAARYTGLSMETVPLRIALDRFMGTVVKEEAPSLPLSRILDNDSKGLPTVNQLLLKHFNRDLFAEIPVVKYYTIAPRVSHHHPNSSPFN
jgi:hypothetical protein